VSGEGVSAAVEPLWTVKDVARFLRRSERWVYGHADKLPGMTRGFGGLRFDPTAVRAAVQGAGSKVLTFPRRPT
jgi:hypothetical protein